MLNKKSCLMILACAASASGIAAMGCGCEDGDKALVTITEVRYSGDGCPEGSVSVEFNKDRTAFTLVFGEYAASLGYVTTWATVQKSCAIEVDLHVPEDYRDPVAAVDYRGYVHLGYGVEGLQRTEYSYSDLEPVVRESRFRGPVEEDYVRRDTFDHPWATGTGPQSIILDTGIDVAQVEDGADQLGMILVGNIDFYLYEDGSAVAE